MNRSVLVTGASSGIGFATAIAAAASGFQVYATMRDLKRAEPLRAAARDQGLAIEVLALDTTNSESIRCVFAHIRERSRNLYGLVNNAGIILRGYFEDVSAEEMRSVYETNVFGSMAVTRAALPMMREARQGRIVVVSSTGGRLASPGNSAYCSSKFALEGFVEALAQEVRPFGIYVTAIEPGFVRTELFGRNRNVAKDADRPESPYRAWFQRLEQFTDAQVQGATIQPEDVAAKILKVLQDPSPGLRYVVGTRARLLLGLRRYLPGDIFDRVWIRELNRRIAGGGQ